MRFFIIYVSLISFVFNLHADDFASFNRELEKGISFTATINHALPQARMWLVKKNNRIEGIYRYEKSTCSLRLSGSVKGSSMKLEEKDCKGKASGSFELDISSSKANINGQWISPDNKKKFDVFLEKSDWILLNDWNWLVPKKAKLTEDRCSVKRNFYNIISTNNNITQKLNQRLSAYDQKFCDSYFEVFPLNSHGKVLSIDFNLLGVRHNFASFQRSSYEFTGGRHGNNSAECMLLDLNSGNEVNLGSYVHPNKRSDLKKLVEKRLKEALAEENQKSCCANLDSALKYPRICLSGPGEGASLEFDEGDSIVPYSYQAGLASVKLTEQELRSFLLKNAVTNAIFK